MQLKKQNKIKREEEEKGEGTDGKKPQKKLLDIIIRALKRSGRRERWLLY